MDIASGFIECGDFAIFKLMKVRLASPFTGSNGSYLLIKQVKKLSKLKINCSLCLRHINIPTTTHVAFIAFIMVEVDMSYSSLCVIKYIIAALCTNYIFSPWEFESDWVSAWGRKTHSYTEREHVKNQV